MSVSRMTVFSMNQAVAAALFSRQCGELEASARRGAPIDPAVAGEHRACAVASITASVAFLEATANEVMLAAEFPNVGFTGALPESDRRILLMLADLAGRVPTQRKFALILKHLQRPAMDTSGQLWRSVGDLVTLRNALVHQRIEFDPPLTDPTRTTTAATLAARLEHSFSAQHPFTGVENPFFPDRCLGHAGTRWAWASALEFADTFLKEHLGITPFYEDIRAQLMP